MGEGVAARWIKPFMFVFVCLLGWLRGSFIYSFYSGYVRCLCGRLRYAAVRLHSLVSECVGVFVLGMHGRPADNNLINGSSGGDSDRYG